MRAKKIVISSGLWGSLPKFINCPYMPSMAESVSALQAFLYIFLMYVSHDNFRFSQIFDLFSLFNCFVVPSDALK